MKKEQLLQNLSQIEEFLLSDIFYVEEDYIDNDDFIEAIQIAIKVISVATQSAINSDLERYKRIEGRQIV